MRFIFYILIGILALDASAQEPLNQYDEITRIATPYVAPIKAGEIEFLENANPPKDAWTYKKLQEYQKALDHGAEMIYFGSYIGPSADQSNYGYNYFAYKELPDGSFSYYFVIIVSINVQDNYKVEDTYLFTEEPGLKNWWGHTFSMYNSGKIEQVPIAYRYPVCPPPPFKD